MQRIKQWVLIISVASVLLAVMPLLPAAAQADNNWTCVAINGTSTLNVRSGPGVAYGVIATAQPGDQFLADYTRQVNADSYRWVPIRPAGDDAEGWAITQRLDLCVDGGAAIPTAVSPAIATDNPPLLASGLVMLDGVNADGWLDRDEIAIVARSVVLLASVRNNRIQSTGTGTVVSPDGLIITNAHVVEDAEIVAVGVLGDINDPPDFLYLGEIIKRDDTIDVALVAIRSDIDGNPLRAGDLSLSFVPPSVSADTVYRGDQVYIFGYPGIGNDFLVVTTGSIVSVENGDLFGQRIPVWYRTDAEIAPGNSGGLVVNGNGEFVGIPTFVEAEGVTGGRLGGIRPAEVALMAVMDTISTKPSEPMPLASEATPPVTIDRRSVAVRHAAEVYGEPGIVFDVMFTIAGWAQQPAEVIARVYHDNLASTPLINPGAPAQYRDSTGAVRVRVPIQPCCEQSAYVDSAALALFLPYSVLGIAAPGTHALKVQVALQAGDGSWQSTLSWEFLTVRVE